MWRHPNYYKNLRKLARLRNRDQAISDQAATADGERAPGTGLEVQIIHQDLSDLKLTSNKRSSSQAGGRVGPKDSS